MIRPQEGNSKAIVIPEGFEPLTPEEEEELMVHGSRVMIHG